MIAGDGRPLRFVAGIGGGWVALRILLLWHDTGSLSEAVRGVLPLPVEAAAAETMPAALRVAPRAMASRSPTPTRALTTTAAAPAATGAIAPDPVRVQMALIAMTRFGSPTSTEALSSPQPDTAAPAGSTARVMLGHSAVTSRLSVSSWMIARGGMARTPALVPQLGGTQGGVRVDYALGGGFAATARVAAPAAGAGRELSLGVALRPRGVPLRLVAEQRLSLDGGRSGPSLGVSGGVDAVALPAGFALQGYAQAGTILRSGLEHYADGSARATRAIGEVGGLTVEAGAGAWGGAQRGVARLDLGPSIGAAVPIAGRRLRVSVDWRQRVAGNARPGSGPALTLGTDF